MGKKQELHVNSHSSSKSLCQAVPVCAECPSLHCANPLLQSGGRFIKGKSKGSTASCYLPLNLHYTLNTPPFAFLGSPAVARPVSKTRKMNERLPFEDEGLEARFVLEAQASMWTVSAQLA